MHQTEFSKIKKRWANHWSLTSYKRLTVAGISILLGTLIIMPHFFQTIEKREGTLLSDWVLAAIPAQDVSIPIFIFIWGTTLLIIIRAIQNPTIFITFLWSYVIVTLSRLISISLIPLNAPTDLIPLIDPISNYFYGETFVTKDLFYSGHVSTQFLMFLCFKKSSDKIFSLCAVVSVAVLLLIQHVHYTLDIVAAPIFSYMFWLIAKKITNTGHYYSNSIDLDKPITL